MSVIPTYVGNVVQNIYYNPFKYNNQPLLYLNTRECRWYLWGKVR